MFNGERLGLARKRRRQTARILAETAGLSVVTLSRIENGKQEPDEATVEKLASALRYPLSFFYRGDVDAIGPDNASFRSLTSMTARERDAAIAASSLAFEVVDWVKGRFNLPSADLVEWDHESDPAAAARMLRQAWAIGEQPIGNIIKLLEAKGIRVFSLAENTKNVDAFSFWRGEEPYIFLNTFKSAERSRFDAAHELGHLVLHKHGAPQGREAEQQANAFASSFLMPKADVESLVPYVSSLADLIPIKRRWGVSLAALVYRLNKLRLITEWQNRDFYIRINRDFGTNEPNGIERERSAIWQMVMTELWKEGTTREHISSDLALPPEELDNLWFGLTADIGKPKTESGPPKLRIV